MKLQLLWLIVPEGIVTTVASGTKANKKGTLIDRNILSKTPQNITGISTFNVIIPLFLNF